MRLTLPLVIGFAILGAGTAVQCNAAPAYIHLGAQPTKSASMAAEELKHYLGRIVGQKIPVYREGSGAPPPGDAVVVGDSQRAKALGFDSTELAPEQIRLKTGEDWVLVLGSDRGPTGFPLNGTRWAAYELLERLGVRWLWPGPLGEVVPSTPDLRVPELDISYTPPIIQRAIRNLQYRERVQTGLDKLGFTREQFEAVHGDGRFWFTRQRLATQGRFSYGHAFGHWWDDYHEEHPDWFARQPNGTRDQGNIGDRARLCVSNPEVVAKAAEEAMAKLAARPDLLCASISPNDGGRATFCLCDECRALDPPEAPRVQIWHPKIKPFEVPSLTDRYVHFYNQVAAMVAKRFPDRYLAAYAYSAYRLPPVRDKLHPNVFIGFVGLSYMTHSARREQLAAWDAWTKAAKRFFLRPNFLGGGMGYPALFPHRMVEDLKHCFDTGMRVTDFDCCYQHWALKGINYYVLARFLWNPRIDVDEVIDDYCRAGWGPAAGPVRDYFDTLEAIVDRIALDNKHLGRKKTPEVPPSYYTDEVLGQLQKHLEAAEELAAGDETIRARVEFLRTGLTYTRLNRDRMLALTALRRREGDRETYERAHDALEDYYRQMGITWAVNSPYLKFYGF